MNNDGFDTLEATNKQKKLYFVLMRDMGYSSDDAKHILKRRFNLDSFADIDKERMSFVIDRLLIRKEKENAKRNI